MICEGLIRKLTSHVFDKNGQESCNSNTLARLLFVVGHVAVSCTSLQPAADIEQLKQLVHLENIEVELKRRHGIEDDRSEKSKHSKVRHGHLLCVDAFDSKMTMMTWALVAPLLRMLKLSSLLAFQRTSLSW